jgi:hypothetical protein
MTGPLGAGLLGAGLLGAGVLGAGVLCVGVLGADSAGADEEPPDGAVCVLFFGSWRSAGTVEGTVTLWIVTLDFDCTNGAGAGEELVEPALARATRNAAAKATATISAMSTTRPRELVVIRTSPA